MGIGLEKRLRKLEKIQQAKMDKLYGDHEWVRRRDELMKLGSTPEGRALAMESAERMVDKFRAEERAQIAAMTQPEKLADLKKQWAEEDAKEKVRRKQAAEWEARMEARDNAPCQCRDCAPVQRNTGDDKAKILDEDEEEEWFH